MTGEQPKPQPMTASPLDKMAEGLLGRLVMGDIPEDEKADILAQLTGELRALRITLSAHGKVMLQQNELLESMQNMLAFWNNNLVDWVKDPEGKALKARVRSTLEKYTDIGYFDLIDTSEEVGAMVEAGVISLQPGRPVAFVFIRTSAETLPYDCVALDVN